MRETSTNDEVAVRQRLARLRREPEAGPAREIVPPLPRTAAAVSALPGAVTTTPFLGTAAASYDRGAAPGRSTRPAPRPASPGTAGVAARRGAVPRVESSAPRPAGTRAAGVADRRDSVPRQPSAPRPSAAGRGDAPDAADPAYSVGSAYSADPAYSADAAEAVEGVPRPSRFGGMSAFDPGRRGTRALAVVALVVVAAAAVLAWRSRPQPEAVPVAPAAVASVSAEPAVSGGDVVAAVAGKVRRPGLVTLPAGARVADAIEAAGGALPGVDVALLNPARKISDGELILVGITAPPGGDGAAASTGAAGNGAPGVGGKVNLNTAGLAELDALPGVGPVLAQRILDHRQRHGPFRSVGDLRQVDGIGDARYEQLKDLVTV